MALSGEGASPTPLSRRTIRCKIRRMSVRVSAQDFGPITRGTVALKPLTVFIGPNNAGKSYFAMLTYAANHRVPFGVRRFRYLRIRPLTGVDRQELEYTKEVEGFLQMWQTTGRIPTGAAAASVMQKLEGIVRGSLATYGTELAAEIERCFGRELTELVRIGGAKRKKCWVGIHHGNPRWALRLKVGEGSPRVEVTITPDVGAAFRQAMRADGLHRVRGTFLPPERKRHLELLWEQIVELTLDRCFAEFPRLAYYLPAARSGILQSHKLLAGIIVSRSSFAGIEDMQVGKLTGVLSDFISHLLQLEPRNKAGLAGVADYLESDVLRGEIRITGSRPAYPEIVYQAGEGKYQLPGTSSMVSELAPVVLFLRYLVDPGEMLVIEEPESHLHPAVQRKFARAIARLANSGVTVVLTTHSDYFLTQINNLILASNLDSKARVQAGYADEECLDVSAVAAYLFKPEADAQGTAVKRMRLTRARGISQAEFAKAAEALYAETIALERNLLDAN